MSDLPAKPLMSDAFRNLIVGWLYAQIVTELQQPGLLSPSDLEAYIAARVWTDPRLFWGPGECGGFAWLIPMNREARAQDILPTDDAEANGRSRPTAKDEDVDAYFDALELTYLPAALRLMNMLLSAADIPVTVDAQRDASGRIHAEPMPYRVYRLLISMPPNIALR